MVTENNYLPIDNKSPTLVGFFVCVSEGIFPYGLANI